MLHIKDLDIAFKKGHEWVDVIHKLELRLERGEVLGVVGESGSGKTVSSLACMGLLPPKISRVKHGTAIFGDAKEDLLSKGVAERYRGKKITMIFQEPMSSLNPSMRCGQQVMEMITEHVDISAKAAQQRALQLFKEVELPVPEQMLFRYPHELSGGQKQRVMIAMALASDPELIIADEPTTALDVTVQKSVLDLLKKLQEQRQMAMIFISHDLAVVSRIADKVAVMYQGKVVESGPAEKVFASPEHPYTKGLLACVPKRDGMRRKLVTVRDVMEGRLSHDTVYPKPSSEDLVLTASDLNMSFPVKRNIMGKVIKTYDAVRGVSLHLKKGETLGIVGESGCGKSTLSRMLLGLITPSGGSIEWHVSPKGKKRIAQLVFQDPYSSLNPKMSVASFLTEALMVSGVASNKKDAREQAIRLVVQVGLDPDHIDRYPHSFSGGQRQRLVIARALCADPQVLILDESVAALDISVQAQVLNLLNDLKQGLNLTYIFISHDLHVVHYMSDRILVMKEGKIVEQGDAHEVFTQPRERYTRHLLEASVSL